MKLRRGTRARFNLVDGSTIEGTVQRSWMWWAWKITRPELHTPQGAVAAEGYVLVSRRHTVFVQALRVETDPGGE